MDQQDPSLLRVGQTPFDDHPREECGVFGMYDVPNASNLTVLGLYALQHRGQEAAGIASKKVDSDVFHVVRRTGLVRDNFTNPSVIERLQGNCTVGHTRYSTAGKKGHTEIRDVQPLYAELSRDHIAIAHNGNITNSESLRHELIGSRGAIFQSGSDTETILHLMAQSNQRKTVERLKDALRVIEGAFSIVAQTSDAMIGVRDPMGIRPLVLGRIADGYVLSSETCALDIVGAQFMREIEPGEMVIISKEGIVSEQPFAPQPPRFCVFEYVYFSRPDSEYGGKSVGEVRRRIGEFLADECPVPEGEGDVIVCAVPDSGTAAAIGFARKAGLQFEQGVIKNQYSGRTFILPDSEKRALGVRQKLNVNRRLIEGKRVVLVDDSVVRGTTSEQIGKLVREAGAKEVHFRVASPPTAWPCFYGVDTPERSKLLAATKAPSEMASYLKFDSLGFISIDGLYQACTEDKGRDAQQPKFCDACFTGDYPVPPSDRISAGEVDPPMSGADTIKIR
ncbi:MAG: amidophosphoribosyltransferase [Neomegalonema sp.]|nr:amidophosphoribosyltransferase [Neomegalonema sp.]